MADTIVVNEIVDSIVIAVGGEQGPPGITDFNPAISLVGDVTATGTTGQAVTTSLANTQVVAGDYGSAAKTLTITVDSKGRLQAVQENNLAIDANSINAGIFSTERMPSFSGDASTVAGSTVLTLASTGVNAGDYTKVTVDEKGRVTGGTNPATLGTMGIIDAYTKVEVDAAVASATPSFETLTGKPTTISGYGITDAQVTLVSGTNIKTINGTSILGSGDIVISGGGGGSGTVTLVSGTTPITVTNGDTTPTISISQASNTVNGYLSSADWSTFNGKQAALGFTPYDSTNPSGYTSNLGTVTSVSGIGTVSGLTLTGSVTSSGSLTLGGTLAVDYSSLTGTVPTWNQNTTGTAAGLSTTLAISSGGTGATTLAGAKIPVWDAANTFTGTQTFSGTSNTLAVILTNAAETTTISATAATGTIAYYTNSQSVLYYTSNATANWTLNITHSVGITLNTTMAVGQTITVTHMVTNGTTAFYNNAVRIDGTALGVTIKWQGGSAPTSGNASAIDVYTYAIIKTADSTFTVLAAVSKFA